MDNNPTGLPGSDPGATGAATYDGGAQTTTGANGNGSSSSGSEPLQQVMQQAREKASEAAEQAKQQLNTQFSDKKSQAAQSLTDVAEAIRETGQCLQNKSQSSLTQYTDKAAEQIERVSQMIEEKDLDDILREARDWARTQPALFIGGAFALGLIAARLIKNADTSGQSQSNGSDYGASNTMNRSDMAYAGGTYGSSAASAPVAALPPTTNTGNQNDIAGGGMSDGT